MHDTHTMEDMSCICGLTCVVQYADPSCVEDCLYVRIGGR